MRRLIYLLSALLLLSFSLNTHVGRIVPIHNGVDEELKAIVNDYLELAKIKGIVFKKKVGVGFTSIHRGNVVGLCHYGTSFREIDIDREYWDRASRTSKRTLLFHELTHCYCTRPHDHDDGTAYVRNSCPAGDAKTGYYGDGCPKSVMFPSVLEDDCVTAHSADYLEEMFNRCVSY